MNVELQPLEFDSDVEILAPAAPHVLPAIVRRVRFGLDPVRWAADNMERVETLLARHGAVVLQGFKINGSAHFEQLIAAMYRRDLLEYTNRSTPRTQVKGRIYTSTEYPPDETIPLHNENAYTGAWPSRLFFFCVQPSASGGETTVADSRRVLARISPRVRERFERDGVRYVRNFGCLDLPWQEVFQTDEPAHVENFCREHGIAYVWKPDGGLRTEETRQAVTTHPVSGEKVWFNQAHLFHVSALGDAVRSALVEGIAEDEWPRNAYFGDGSPIDVESLADVRAAFDAETVSRPWRAGEILLMDNVLAAHGRRPFEGERKVLVGMV